MLVDNEIIEGAVSGGSFISERLNICAERHYVSIVFYTDSTMSTVANPTAGTVDVDASETGEQYGNVTTITASEAGEDSDYDRPLIAGSITNVRMTFSGVTGATHFKAKISGFDNS